MKVSSLSRGALSVSVALGVLVGCGGSQTGTTIALSEDRPAESQAAVPHKASSSGNDLLYVVSDTDEAYVINYATGKETQRLTLVPFSYGTGACSDRSGNVYITGYIDDNGYIYEFSHGGKSPITALDDTGNPLAGCAVDPATGNIAVAGAAGVAIYPGSIQDKPKLYKLKGIGSFFLATYDNQDDLFVMAREKSGSVDELVELPSGRSKLINLPLNEELYPTALQWDGTYLALTEPAGKKETSPTVDRVQTSGSGAKVISSVTFKGIGGRFAGWVSLIVGKTIILNYHQWQRLGIGKYPAGGKVMPAVRGLRDSRLSGLTLSVSTS